MQRRMRPKPVTQLQQKHLSRNEEDQYLSSRQSQLFSLFHTYRFCKIKQTNSHEAWWLTIQSALWKQTYSYESRADALSCITCSDLLLVLFWLFAPHSCQKLHDIAKGREHRKKQSTNKTSQRVCMITAYLADSHLHPSSGCCSFSCRLLCYLQQSSSWLTSGLHMLERLVQKSVDSEA